MQVPTTLKLLDERYRLPKSAVTVSVTRPPGQGLYEMIGTTSFAISLSMLVLVLAFAIVTELVPYGSPAEVIKTFYSACNSGNYSVAERLLVPESKRVLTLHIRAVDGDLPGICEEETKQGHLQRVEVLDENVHGDLAQVRYKLYYADGSTIEDSQGLVARHWVWKISP